MNNTSFLTADRDTHVKIVIVALVAAIVVTAVAISAHISGPGLTAAHDRDVLVRAGEATRYSAGGEAAIH